MEYAVKVVRPLPPRLLERAYIFTATEPIELLGVINFHSKSREVKPVTLNTIRIENGTQL